MNPSEALVDAGSGRLAPGGEGPIRVGFCVRGDCGRAPEPGHDFCGPCLAWLRGDEDEDPIPAVVEFRPGVPANVRWPG